MEINHRSLLSSGDKKMAVSFQLHGNETPSEETSSFGYKSATTKLFTPHATLGQMADKVQAIARAGAAGSLKLSELGDVDTASDNHNDGDIDDTADDDDAATCQPGQEQTGRWTRKEHTLFLEAMKKFGKEWKRVASAVKTRTVVQTRTHAQKYFQKLNKSGSSLFEMDYEEIEDVNHTSSHEDSHPSTLDHTVLDDSFDDDMCLESDADLLSSLIDVSNFHPHGSSTSVKYDSTVNQNGSGLKSSQPHSQYAFANSTPQNFHIPPIMNSLPQPSPAACGKRKHAELAAAQILAATASHDSTTRPSGDVAAVTSSSRKELSFSTNIDSVNRRHVVSLSIIDPDSIESFPSEFKASLTPATPWEADMRALHRSNLSNVVTGALEFHRIGESLEFDSPVFLDKIRLFIKRGLCGELEKLLEAAIVNKVDLTIGSESLLSSSPATNAVDTCYATPAYKNDNKNMKSDEQGGEIFLVELLNELTANGTTLLTETCGLKSSAEHKDVDEASILSSCKLLIKFGATVNVSDKSGDCPLHVAARLGYDKVGRYLINKGCSINIANSTSGDCAIHVAAKFGHISFLEMMADMGANCHSRNGSALSALDLLGAVEEGSTRSSSRASYLTFEPRLRTLVLYHDDCLEHSPRTPLEWEGPDRLRDVMCCIESGSIFADYELDVSSQFDKATVELLSRVHSPEYIAFVDDLSKKMKEESEGPAIVPFTPMVQKFMYHQSEDDLKKSEYSDTPFSAGTLRAARRAAGAVAHAVDRILLGRNRNAFCLIRPPSHHAGYYGLLNGALSCGFCIFNSVAAGAMHALEVHNCDRVAIVDLDIHHGNGTEDIVRRYKNPSRLFFFSLHLFETDDITGYQFFPGSGAQDDMVHNIINVPLLPLWSGSATKGKSTPHPYPAGHLVGREAYRQAIQQRLLPSLRAFNPSLILLSSGFDGAADDVGNQRGSGTAHVERGMDLTPTDFEWATTEVLKVADICCNGKVVSALEGGYGSVGSKSQARTNTRSRGNPSPERTVPESGINRSTLTNSVLAHINRLVDPFGSSRTQNTSL